MKKLYIFKTIFLFNFLTFFGQATDVVNLSFPYGMAVNGDLLYIGQDVDNKISSIDITSATPTLTELTPISAPYGMAVNGNFLYVAQTFSNKISRIDLTDPMATVTDFVTGANSVRDFAFQGNDLYFTGFTNAPNGSISKVDVTQPNPTITEVITGLDQPGGIAISENLLFLADTFGNDILVADLSDPNPTFSEYLTNISLPLGLLIEGNFLYIGEIGTSKVLRVDITEPTPTVTEVVSGIAAAVSLVIANNELYIVEGNDDKISKFDLGILSTEEESFVNSVKMFPNPTESYITFTGLKQKSQYSIYNILGSEVKNGIIANQEQIDVRNLNRGMYIIKFDNRITLKFLKN